MALCIYSSPIHLQITSSHNPQPNYTNFLGNPSFKKSVNFSICKPVLAVVAEEIGKVEEEKPKFRWVKISPNITEAQQQAISQLPPHMTNRCKAIMKQIICSSYEAQNASLSDLVDSWVRIMKPRRTDWLSVLKQLKNMEHPLYLEVAELALLQESFEANVRDYTKVIHSYGKANQIQNAEKTLFAMKKRGFVIDQVALTAMITMYSKAGNLKQAEETFAELKLLGYPLDKRAYGSMIMSYIRAGVPEKGEFLLTEMDAQEIQAGSEVYKALLRAYSMLGNTDGAQRVFNTIQIAGILPDIKLCGLLINAYQIAGESRKAKIAFENMRRAGIEPSDKCIALVLGAYEKENNLNEALKFLMELEKEGIMVGKEASGILACWFRRLGVLKEVELVLKEYLAHEVNSEIPV